MVRGLEFQRNDLLVDRALSLKSLKLAFMLFQSLLSFLKRFLELQNLTFLLFYLLFERFLLLLYLFVTVLFLLLGECGSRLFRRLLGRCGRARSRLLLLWHHLHGVFVQHGLVFEGDIRGIFQSFASIHVHDVEVVVL
jgi:hypothetical protein